MSTNQKISDEDHKALIKRLNKLRELEWDRFNLISLEESFLKHEKTIKELKELIPDTNAIFETYLSEIIYLGKLQGKPVEMYEEHFFT